MKLRFLLPIMLALGVTALAHAHPIAYSSLDIERDATGVRGTLLVRDYDAAHELQLTAPEALLEA